MTNHEPMNSSGQGRRTLVPDAENSLDTIQLQELEKSFRNWARSSKRSDIRASRSRILLIFLIIRYTGARLNEVAQLDLRSDFDRTQHTFRFEKKLGKKEPAYREVQIPESIAQEMEQMVIELTTEGGDYSTMFRIDPAHVRRKFYERAKAIGLVSGMGAPEIIRKSRAVELIRSNMPLQVIQKILGHSTPNLAASYVEFSDNDLNEVAKYYADRENKRKTSARNSFFGKINALHRGEIQTLVEITSLSGNTISSIITNGSLGRLGLKSGMLITAEVKAPMVQICKSEHQPKCSAENIFQGTVSQLSGNHMTVEVIVQLEDGTELCAIMSEKIREKLELQQHDRLWVFFDAFAVVLHID